jgi:biotin-dependent carboxylase-like uncharacterized protein
VIEVIQPGLYTTIQDAGRPGFYGFGVPPSGAMDMYSYQIANVLVGNSPGAISLEATFLGPRLRFGEDALIAVTGASVDVMVDGEAQPSWRNIPIRSGQEVWFGPTVAGARIYVSVRGGFDVPTMMGSASTYVLSKIGGIDGRTLKSGDILSIGNQADPSMTVKVGLAVPDYLIPAVATDSPLRIVTGLCHGRLTPEAAQTLVSSDFSVSAEANRTGYRLEGPSLSFRDRVPPFGAGSDPSNVVNLGYPVGSLQAPSGAEVICLMRDAVTGGGYATLATVISVDIDRLSQMKFPDRIRFEEVDIETALGARRERIGRINALRDLVRG